MLWSSPRDDRRCSRMLSSAWAVSAPGHLSLSFRTLLVSSKSGPSSSDPVLSSVLDEADDPDSLESELFFFFSFFLLTFRAFFISLFLLGTFGSRHVCPKRARAVFWPRSNSSASSFVARSSSYSFSAVRSFLFLFFPFFFDSGSSLATFASFSTALGGASPPLPLPCPSLAPGWCATALELPLHSSSPWHGNSDPPCLAGRNPRGTHGHEPSCLRLLHSVQELCQSTSLSAQSPSPLHWASSYTLVLLSSRVLHSAKSLQAQ